MVGSLGWALVNPPGMPPPMPPNPPGIPPPMEVKPNGELPLEVLKPPESPNISSKPPNWLNKLNASA
ncbi:hypothetical protein OGATHE_004829 [Ogataea polymorpha]|uniref:Uncharacterized protein n=1 Tax=Ogataea polymorpha TaxID=460523 RepID=A0A9P8P0C2_9ASCO|nr:hypothetical protein OGATHE_004829 [Ogataea polymorpha]